MDIVESKYPKMKYASSLESKLGTTIKDIYGQYTIFEVTDDGVFLAYIVTSVVHNTLYVYTIECSDALNQRVKKGEYIHSDIDNFMLTACGEMLAIFASRGTQLSAIRFDLSDDDLHKLLTSYIYSYGRPVKGQLGGSALTIDTNTLKQDYEWSKSQGVLRHSEISGVELFRANDYMYFKFKFNRGNYILYPHFGSFIVIDLVEREYVRVPRYNTRSGFIGLLRTMAHSGNTRSIGGIKLPFQI